MPDPSAEHPDPTPFVELIVKHERALSGYIRSMLPRIDDVEEVWQATAIELWEKFDQYDPQREFLPWAQKFAYFEVLKFRRKAARDRMVFSEEVLQAVADTHAASTSKLEARSRALQGCMKKLSADELNLLRTRYETTTTIGMIADQLQTTTKTLYRRLDRIRDRLAQCVRHHAALAEE
ncbi:sigma-70 family RNA polymerase sigma factor [Blastopirellula sp. JC732]|uniref:Sigma-70 family RNA polymerase sigma factor n=1 Tax=Blastopirellula sediminis TaxID=2894196 RepID=A0A9X1MNT5_9BACT|nr:sigma-70 family RNA polymerase sigma factor [Blastopirellula sediminis]MCC9607127.1 sigma-70 family RNA polymerase sigma factor [Blastopirellula sediminis]MCC9629580.1 sigma-70 family RNA polymerase sigma factor [Blastopirellula sediminis]